MGKVWSQIYCVHIFLDKRFITRPVIRLVVMQVKCVLQYSKESELEWPYHLPRRGPRSPTSYTIVSGSQVELGVEGRTKSKKTELTARYVGLSNSLTVTWGSSLLSHVLGDETALRTQQQYLSLVNVKAKTFCPLKFWLAEQSTATFLAMTFLFHANYTLPSLILLDN